jgi:hypothetical protein
MTLQEMQEIRVRWRNNLLRNHDNSYYVYLYRYPSINGLPGRVFYVGYGQNNRVFDHLDLTLAEDRVEYKKVKIINELREKGCTPDIDILRTDLNKSQATIIESAVIDAIGLKNLTNIQSGHQSEICPITIFPAVLERAEIHHNILGIKINDTFRKFFPGLVYNHDHPVDLQTMYECTSSLWKINSRKFNSFNVEFFCAIYKGVIMEVFKFDSIETVEQAIDRKHARVIENKLYIEGYKYRQIEYDVSMLMRKILKGDKATDDISDPVPFFTPRVS